MGVGVGHAGESYGIASDFNTGLIYDVDLQTGEFSNPRATGIYRFGGLEFAGSELYGLSTDVAAGALYRIDQQTGASTLIGSLGQTRVVEGDLAYDPGTGRMFGSQNVYPNLGNSVFELDLASGKVIFSRIIRDVGDLDGLAFDGGGNLWAMDVTNDMLLRLDTSNMHVLETVELSQDIVTSSGIDWDPSSRTMYLIEGKSNRETLYTVDLGTGEVAHVGDVQVPGRMSAITIVPAPASVSGVLLGASAVLRRRRSCRHAGVAVGVGAA
ncbi:MAG: hypothetical protein DHS20C14_22010 [Phycisphaeraceae bacterium]|nr:MAG: hypothetical protein DHS20C14_22010 [Phycisphaeraceae bacterium]